MDWWLALLAVLSITAFYIAFSPRVVPRKGIPWGVFILSLLTIELAWLWLPIQLIAAWLLIHAGAADSSLGTLALLVLIVSWCGLAWFLWRSTKTGEVVDKALNEALGFGFEQQIPTPRQGLLRKDVTFSDWANPFKFSHPDVELIKHIPYGPAGIRQQLDIYRPRKRPPEGCPVLLQIHGGAWVIGDKADQARPLMQLMASKGWICVAANYRLSPSISFPTHLEDCKAALCWIREHGAEYGMNTDFVAVTGGSAGGHLAALMGLTANRKDLQGAHPDTDTSVQACVPFYGVYDFLVRYHQHPNRDVYQKFISHRVIHQSLEDAPELWELASPITHIHENAPPFMVIHGDQDSMAVVNEGRVFSRKLQDVAHNPVVYVELPGAEHAFDSVHSLRTEHVINGIHRFLESVYATHQANKQETVTGD